MFMIRIGVQRSKQVDTNTSVVGPRADHLVIQQVHKGLEENELRAIIAEEVTRGIQAAMPAILEMTCKMIKDRIGVDKEEKQVNEVEKEDFSDCMPEFSGVCEPISSLRWILEIENIFKAIKCADADKVAYAVSKLRLEAKLWWDIVKDEKCGPTKMTWSRFKEVFKDKFCPISVVMQQEDEFLTFKQGNLLVKEYTAHFVDMARFVEHLVATEDRKIERYVRGLKIDIRELISTKELVTFWEVVEAAQEIENKINTRFEENNDIKRKKAGKKVSFSDKHDLFVFDSS
ncbi:zinc finger, CCHC-type, Retrotransposon gag domain protein [Artemisia annua]|uniref:Zinc finger, CCHC-type, Retrotransposon gag domain protein n=1 Tax=Artemisia annua TaxID=35608 RepID=A0A2U1M098_ARTAN|nr:zinc finger, CCHC-type, Retrotransposon gag domain protein [Artemisia annua]